MSRFLGNLSEAAHDSDSGRTTGFSAPNRPAARENGNDRPAEVAEYANNGSTRRYMGSTATGTSSSRTIDLF